MTKNILRLNLIFSRYAGNEIRNPDRMTCDVDPVIESVSAHIRTLGFIAGKPHDKASGTPAVLKAGVVSPEFETGTDKKIRLIGKFAIGK